ncbi:MAG: YceH family protein [Pyrinomonadaceae bacterium]|jgi:hypothetical protein|nr:YceH family protein [Pyrinomonadaceae bacterium]
MEAILNEIEARIIGCLIEKEATTPEYYPLTLNALVNACNQKSNRFPVVNYDEKTVSQALEDLREKHIAYVFYGSTSRVPKYKHILPKFLELELSETAILCVLMLRGFQTIGELKERTSRIYEFSSLEEVHETLDNLRKRETPLVIELPKQSGQKEPRYAHLLCGEISAEMLETVAHTPTQARQDQIAKLESEVEELKTNYENLRAEFEEFKKQFD